MKLHTILILFIATLMSISCATTEDTTSGLERSEIAINSMEQVHEEINTTITRVDQVESSLRNLNRSNQTDLESAYASYSEDVSKLEETGNRLLNRKDEMHEKADNYFSGWESDVENYDNPRLKNVSKERREEIQEKYSEVREESRELDRILSNFISDTKEIREYLSNDLTPSGIQAIDSLSDDLMDSSDDIRDTLSDMREALGETLEEMGRS